MTSLHLLSDEQAQTVSGGFIFVRKSNSTTVSQGNGAVNLALAGTGGAGILNLQGNSAIVGSAIL